MNFTQGQLLARYRHCVAIDNLESEEGLYLKPEDQFLLAAEEFSPFCEILKIGLEAYMKVGPRGNVTAPNLCYSNGSNCQSVASGSSGNVSGGGASNRIAIWNNTQNLTSSPDVTYVETNKLMSVGTTRIYGANPPTSEASITGGYMGATTYPTGFLYNDLGIFFGSNVVPLGTRTNSRGGAYFSMVNYDSSISPFRYAFYPSACSAYSETDQATCENNYQCTWNDPDCEGQDGSTGYIVWRSTKLMDTLIGNGNSQNLDTVSPAVLFPLAWTIPSSIKDALIIVSAPSR